MAAKPRGFQLAITFSLLTTSGWGNPSPCSQLSRSFPSSLCWISAGPIPIPDTHTQVWACWACLPAPVTASTGCCLSAWNAAFSLSGMQEGRDKEAGVTHQEDKRILHVFHTHFAWQPLTSSGGPKASKPRKRRESPQTRHVVFKITKNRDLCHFLNIQTPNLLS